MDDQTKSRFSTQTLVAQALGACDPVTRGIVPPIHMATTYLRDADNGYRAGYVYGRTDNVSVQQAESLIAALEKASTKDTALLQLQPDADQRRLRLTAEARNREAMFAYVQRLERSPALAEVHLISHQVQAEDPQHPIQFSLQATLK